LGPARQKEWVNHNLIVRRQGKHIGAGMLTVVTITAPSKDTSTVPVELAAIAGMLIPLSVQSAESIGCPGVYFLCHDQKVVYVGQSADVLRRVGAHIGDRSFDSVWFVRVPLSDL
jgi:hypothetical protein